MKKGILQRSLGEKDAPTFDVFIGFDENMKFSPVTKNVSASENQAVLAKTPPTMPSKSEPTSSSSMIRVNYTKTPSTPTKMLFENNSSLSASSSSNGRGPSPEKFNESPVQPKIPPKSQSMCLRVNYDKPSTESIENKANSFTEESKASGYQKIYLSTPISLESEAKRKSLIENREQNHVKKEKIEVQNLDNILNIEQKQVKLELVRVESASPQANVSSNKKKPTNLKSDKEASEKLERKKEPIDKSTSKTTKDIRKVEPATFDKSIKIEKLTSKSNGNDKRENEKPKIPHKMQENEKTKIKSEKQESGKAKTSNSRQVPEIVRHRSERQENERQEAERIRNKYAKQESESFKEKTKSKEKQENEKRTSKSEAESQEDNSKSPTVGKKLTLIDMFQDSLEDENEQIFNSKTKKLKKRKALDLLEKHYPKNPKFHQDSMSDFSDDNHDRLIKRVLVQNDGKVRSSFEKARGSGHHKSTESSKQKSEDSSETSSHKMIPLFGFKTEANDTVFKDKNVPSTSAIEVKEAIDNKTVVTQKSDSSSNSPSKPEESPENVNKINNNINIIFTLNSDLIKRKTKSPKKPRFQAAPVDTVDVEQSIDLITKSYKTVKTVDTQTEAMKLEQPEKIEENATCKGLMFPCPTILEHGPVEKIYFEGNILVVIQENIITYFECEKLKLLLSGKVSFTLVDRFERRVFDEETDVDNNNRICSDQGAYPIYVEMRGKQRALEDPENMCPLASMYCQIYYVENKKIKFASVQVDTVKSLISDVRYTTIPQTCYFIVSWHERLEDNTYKTGVCKYNLTPDLSLAKLASIRQFPALLYKVTRMSCIEDDKLITMGETQMSFFNYHTGDLLISMDLVQHFGLNLTTFEYQKNYVFMVRISDTINEKEKLVKVIGVNKFDVNNFKIIHTQVIQLNDFRKITSTSITSTRHLIITFDHSQTLLMNLENFNQIVIGKKVQTSHKSSEAQQIYVCHDKIITTCQQKWYMENFVNYFNVS